MCTTITVRYLVQKLTVLLRYFSIYDSPFKTIASKNVETLKYENDYIAITQPSGGLGNLGYRENYFRKNKKGN